MSSSATPRGSRRSAQILSTILFVVAIAFAGTAVYIWQFRDDPQDEAPVPTAEAGNYQMANVIQAFRDGGLDAEYGRTPATVKSDQISQPGQNLTIGDQRVFIFLFPAGQDGSGAEDRGAAMADVDASSMTLTTPSGQDVTEGDAISVYGGGNVIAVAVGGDDASNAEIQAVIEGLG